MKLFKSTRMKKLLFIASIVIAAFLFASCEGPAGPAGLNGIDGIDGENGEVACLVCHNDANLYNKKSQFARSSHAAGMVDEERLGAWSSSCVNCHTSIGFIDFVKGLEPIATTAPNGGFECTTCHDVHATFSLDDYALRITAAAPFVAANTVTADFGTSNLCASCHQNRTAAPVADANGNFRITSVHYGPHHGPQANLVYGLGFGEVAGTMTYPAAGSSKHWTENAKCTTCHMGEHQSGTGDHTFKPTVKSCNDCHNATETDFDYGNVQTATIAQLNELRDLLVAQGVMGGDEVEGYHVVPGTYTILQSQAYFNWIGVTEDRSLGVHNPKYIEALLTNTINALKVK